jgi:hypothetical protein
MPRTLADSGRVESRLRPEDKAVLTRAARSLLLRAIERCIGVAQDVGGVAPLIDAKTERAARWYSSYGARPLIDAPRSLVLPLAIVARCPNHRAATVPRHAGR